MIGALLSLKVHLIYLKKIIFFTHVNLVEVLIIFSIYSILNHDFSYDTHNSTMSSDSVPSVSSSCQAA